MISALLLRPLLKLAFHPTVASAAASWGITALQANVSALEATRAELEEAIAQQRALLDTLAEAIVARRAELDALYATESADTADSLAEVPPRMQKSALEDLVCHNPTPHPAHKWHARVTAGHELRDCPGVTTAQ